MADATTNPTWVRSWVMAFLAEHTERIKRSDWPPFERHDQDGEVEIDPYWDAFIWAFLTHGRMTRKLATAASRLVAIDSPEYLDKQLKALMERIAQVEARERAEVAGTSREDAARDSRGCLDCDGTGFARRFSHGDDDSARTATGKRIPHGHGFVLFCGCPFGKFLAMANTPKDGKRPPRSVDECPTLRLDDVPWSDRPDNRYRYHPDRWNAIDDQPIDPDPLPATSVHQLRDDLNSNWRAF